MPFPSFKKLVIPQEKLTSYLLNHLHPVGRFKAAWFENLGYTQNNWEVLREDLINITLGSTEWNSHESPYGVKYEIRGQIGCSGFRQAVVIVIWIDKSDASKLISETELHFVTAYPG